MAIRPDIRLLVATAMMAASMWGAATHAATAPTCGALCGKWQIDASRSDDIKAAIDSAMTTFKEPRPRRQHRNPGTLEGDVGARVEESLGPINTRPAGSEVRRELDYLLRVPEQLTITQQGREFRVGGPAGSPRRLTPGESYTRVDIEGTADIRCTFNEGRLQVSERYDRKRQYSETYAVQRADGSLLVTREVRREGLKPLLIKSRYRPL